MGYFTDRHYLSGEGIRHSRWMGLRGPGFMRWDEVRRVSYSSTWKWFVLEAGDGRKARVSAVMMGLPEFARHVLQHVPEWAVEPETRGMLRQVAGGNLPPVWG